MAYGRNFPITGASCVRHGCRFYTVDLEGFFFLGVELKTRMNLTCALPTPYFTMLQGLISRFSWPRDKRHEMVVVWSVACL